MNQLYRHFDDKGKLLYVGISLSALARLCQHRVHSEWYARIRNVTIQNFDTREQALEAERLAIQNEKPLHNIIWANTDPCPTPLDRARLELTARMVNVEPVYDDSRAAHFLGMRRKDVRELIARGELASVEIEDARGVLRTRITGWDLIDFLERRHVKAKASQLRVVGAE